MNHRDRLEADRRRERLWDLGGILFDANRATRIAAKQDWHRLLTPELEIARDVYAQMVAPAEPLSDITGWIGGVPFHVSREQLRRVWRERRSA